MALRMTRRLSTGIIKIRDRKEVVAEDGSKTMQEVYHVLGAEHSPAYAVVERKKVKRDSRGRPEKDDKGNPVFETMKGNFMPARDEKGRQLIARHGKSFEVNDEDYVLEHHGAILERV